MLPQGPQQDGRKVLKAVESALAAHGAAGIAVDLGMWTLTAGLPSAASAAAAATGPEFLDPAAAAGLGSHAQKRQRHPMASALGVAPSSSAQLRVNMYMQQRGRFDIMASIPKTTSEAEAMCFTDVMRRVQDDLVARFTA